VLQFYVFLRGACEQTVLSQKKARQKERKKEETENTLCYQLNIGASDISSS
jgi:hypothetical protein